MAEVKAESLPGEYGPLDAKTVFSGRGEDGIGLSKEPRIEAESRERRCNGLWRRFAAVNGCIFAHGRRRVRIGSVGEAVCGCIHGLRVLARATCASDCRAASYGAKQTNEATGLGRAKWWMSAKALCTCKGPRSDGAGDPSKCC